MWTRPNGSPLTACGDIPQCKSGPLAGVGSDVYSGGGGGGDGGGGDGGDGGGVCRGTPP